jgi:hypothetical protein
MPLAVQIAAEPPRVHLDLRARPEHSLDLRTWRTERLRQLKETAQYRRLPRVQQALVDYMVRRHENPKAGVFVAQAKLAARFHVSRRTIIRWLENIVLAGIFTVERRYRGAGTKGGRSTNAYRLNPVVFLRCDEVDVTQPVAQLVTAEASLRTHVEAPSMRVHVERRDEGVERQAPPSTGSEPTELAYQTPANSTTNTSTAFTTSPTERWELRRAREDFREFFRTTHGRAPTGDEYPETLEALCEATTIPW